MPDSAPNTTEDALRRRVEEQHAQLATLCLYIHEMQAGTDLPDAVAEIMNEMALLGVEALDERW